jgi:hypothetical protein
MVLCLKARESRTLPGLLDRKCIANLITKFQKTRPCGGFFVVLSLERRLFCFLESIMNVAIRRGGVNSQDEVNHKYEEVDMALVNVVAFKEQAFSSKLESETIAIPSETILSIRPVPENRELPENIFPYDKTDNGRMPELGRDPEFAGLPFGDAEDQKRFAAEAKRRQNMKPEEFHAYAMRVANSAAKSVVITGHFAPGTQQYQYCFSPQTVGEIVASQPSLATKLVHGFFRRAAQGVKSFTETLPIRPSRRPAAFTPPALTPGRDE